ncbi:hypothetical protein Bca52824_063232 [Brassica carinata]|uniref:Uncharacterized protein n=1 Tax=Brassica carinata TaxID=52824 RepID=A0A8X7QG16_BRACI|nr:hypothetical protein Bca52824_063232 [Brassica carinata]
MVQDALRTSGSGGGLPKTAVSNGGGRGRGLLLRGWQVQNTSMNIKIMILCGFVTILVLLGTVSFGNLGSSNADDAVNQNLIKETKPILAESPSASVPNDLDLEEPPKAEVNPNVYGIEKTSISFSPVSSFISSFCCSILKNE